MNYRKISTKVKAVALAFVFIFMMASCSNNESHFISDAKQRADVEKDLNVKMSQLPNGDYFSILDEDMPQQEKEALQFLYAYMFDGDVTDYSGEFYHNNVKAAFKAREEAKKAGQLVGGTVNDNEEKEEEEAKIESLGDGKWRADGSLEIDALSEELGISLPDDAEFDTLAGMILSELSEIPEDGSTFEVSCYGLNIKVEKVEDRRIEWAIVTKLAVSEDEDDNSDD